MGLSPKKILVFWRQSQCVIIQISRKKDQTQKQKGQKIAYERIYLH